MTGLSATKKLLLAHQAFWGGRGGENALGVRQTDRVRTRNFHDTLKNMQPRHCKFILSTPETGLKVEIGNPNYENSSFTWQARVKL